MGVLVRLSGGYSCTLERDLRALSQLDYFIHFILFACYRNLLGHKGFRIEENGRRCEAVSIVDPKWTFQ